MIIKLNPKLIQIGKVLTYTSFIWQLAWSPIYALFLFDHPFTDAFGLVRMSHNPYFNFCGSKSHCKESDITFTKLLVNILLIFAFWAHHIIFSNNRLKNAVVKHWPEYFILERGVFNTIVMMILTSHTIFWQPLGHNVWSFDSRIFFWPSAFMVLVASAITLIAQFSMTSGGDLFGISRITVAEKQGFVDYPLIEKIIHPWIYQVCRHPLMLSALIFYAFIGFNWNFGKFLYSGSFLLGMLIGVYFEERHLQTFQEYRDYQNKVKNRIFPDWLVVFGRKRIY